MTEPPRTEPDYYAVLGVAPDATAGEIERAYRLLAGRRLNSHWRPDRAARELALINAAYGVLGYPDRRADYDRRRARAATAAQETSESDGEGWLDADGAVISYRSRSTQHLPRVQLGRPTTSSPADAIMILLVVIFAVFAALLLANHSPVDLSFAYDWTGRLGLPTGRARSATPLASPSPLQAEAKASPAPATPTPAEPVPPPGALPTAVAGQLFAGSSVNLSSPRPARASGLTVTLKLIRNGQPVPNANVYLVAHYTTVDERQPPGTSTVRTDDSGTATITFNIGDAIANRQVNLDVTALVEGQTVVFQTSFTPQ